MSDEKEVFRRVALLQFCPARDRLGSIRLTGNYITYKKIVVYNCFIIKLCRFEGTNPMDDFELKEGRFCAK
jgi:hypothetical protein